MQPFQKNHLFFGIPFAKGIRPSSIPTREIQPLSRTAMTATFPRYKQRNPPGAIQAVFAVALIFSPALIKPLLDQRARIAVASEYESERPLILSSIQSATRRHDLDTLLRIHGKYADCVVDREFKSLLQDALARVSAREAEMEIAVAKHLDVSRHREEVMIPLTPAPKTVGKEEEKQQLSVLPR